MRHWMRRLATSLVLVGAGCTGTVLDPNGPNAGGDNPSFDTPPFPAAPGGPGDGPTGGNPSGGGDGPITMPGGDNPGQQPPVTPPPPGMLPEVTPAPAARLARLTHAQWAATVRDLFNLDASAPDWASTFRPDPNTAGFLFGNQASTLVVDEQLEDSYNRAAEEVAAYVTPNGSLDPLTRWLPANGTDVERARAFATAFGLRAHRRPLTSAEVDAYVDVFQVGVQNPLDDPPFVAGLRLMIQAFLVSPRFIYRVELAREPEGDVVPLDDYEIASRLSYFLWSSMPDDALFDLAGQGALSDSAEVARQAERMLSDSRASTVVWRFHEVLLDLARYNTINPDRTEFPDLPSNFADLVRQETRLVIDDAFASDLGWLDLMTTTETWINADLAPLYGVVTPLGAQFEKVQLPATERRGIFTQLGWLASHATAFQPDPIHRGVYLTEKIACNALGAPPAVLPPLPPPEGRTNREVVADHTEQEGTVCASCHTTLINPFGFPYENYDATGRIRTVDNGQPVETHAEPLIGGVRHAVSGALELADVLAQNETVHTCYAKHWVEFAFGRRSTGEDAGLLARLARSSLEGASIRTLLAELSSSPAFLTRSAEELQ